MIIDFFGLMYSKSICHNIQPKIKKINYRKHVDQFKKRSKCDKHKQTQYHFICACMHLTIYILHKQKCYQRLTKARLCKKILKTNGLENATAHGMYCIGWLSNYYMYSTNTNILSGVLCVLYQENE